MPYGRGLRNVARPSVADTERASRELDLDDHSCLSTIHSYSSHLLSITRSSTSRSITIYLGHDSSASGSQAGRGHSSTSERRGLSPLLVAPCRLLPLLLVLLILDLPLLPILLPDLSGDTPITSSGTTGHLFHGQSKSLNSQLTGPMRALLVPRLLYTMNSDQAPALRLRPSSSSSHQLLPVATGHANLVMGIVGHQRRSACSWPLSSSEGRADTGVRLRSTFMALEDLCAALKRSETNTMGL